MARLGKRERAAKRQQFEALVALNKAQVRANLQTRPWLMRDYDRLAVTSARTTLKANTSTAGFHDPKGGAINARYAFVPPGYKDRRARREHRYTVVDQYGQSWGGSDRKAEAQSIAREIGRDLFRKGRITKALDIVEALD